MFANFWENSSVKKVVTASYSFCRDALTGENIKSFCSTIWENVNTFFKVLWAKLTIIVTNEGGDRPIVDRASNAGHFLWDFFVQLPFLALARVTGAAINTVVRSILALLTVIEAILDDAKELISMPFSKAVEMIDNRKDTKVEQQNAA